MITVWSMWGDEIVKKEVRDLKRVGQDCSNPWWLYMYRGNQKILDVFELLGTNNVFIPSLIKLMIFKNKIKIILFI